MLIRMRFMRLLNGSLVNFMLTGTKRMSLPIARVVTSLTLNLMELLCELLDCCCQRLERVFDWIYTCVMVPIRHFSDIVGRVAGD